MYGEHNPPPSKENLGTTLIVIISVVFTIVAAIFFSVADGLLIRLPPPVLPTQVALAPTSTPITPTEDPPRDTPTATITSTPTPSPTSRPQFTATPTPSPVPTIVAMVAEQTCGNVPDGWVSYNVQSGDTLYQLSMSSGATKNEVVQANCLSLNILYSGTQIFLPRISPVREPCGPPFTWEHYVVQRGDTISSLARNYGTTVYSIMQANCLVDSQIFYGRPYYLPPTISAQPPSETATDLPVSTETLVPQPPATNVPPTSAPETLYRIDSPSAGEQVSGFVSIIGSANFNPSEVQYYKLEIMSVASPTSWTTFGSTHRNSVTNGHLETLHAYSLPPGDYNIRLVIVRNDGNFPPPFTVPISIVP